MTGQKKSFQDYLSKEQVMQAEAVRLISLRYPDLFWWHTENEGERTPFEQFTFKVMGGRKGVSDLVILEEGNFSKGLMAELKWGRGGCTKEQVDFLIWSAKKGYTAAVVYDDARDVLHLIDDHLTKGTIIPSEGILYIKGTERKTVKFEDAHQVLIKKGSVKSDQAKAKELFKANALKKFGKMDKAKLFSHQK
jgi:hypothetical protein